MTNCLLAVSDRLRLAFVWINIYGLLKSSSISTSYLLLLWERSDCVVINPSVKSIHILAVNSYLKSNRYSTLTLSEPLLLLLKTESQKRLKALKGFPNKVNPWLLLLPACQGFWPKFRTTRQMKWSECQFKQKQCEKNITLINTDNTRVTGSMACEL